MIEEDRPGGPVRDRTVVDDDFAAWVRASCVASGVDEHVTDRATIQKVVALLGGPTQGRPAPATSGGTSGGEGHGAD